jgi:outer membrane protein assembly factor BamB
MSLGKGWKFCMVVAGVVAATGLWAHLGAQAGNAGGAAAPNVPKAGPVSTDWASYRGPSDNGISAEAGWRTDWDKNAPKQLWKMNVGKGYSSVAVVGGKLYTLGNVDDKNDTLWCISAKDGNVIWQKSYPCGSAKENPGPRSTPTVDGGLVYTVSRAGQIICWDAATGGQKWMKDGKKEFAGKSGSWSFAGSATIADKAVLVDVGTVVALDKLTGNLIWKSEKTWQAGYATPTLFTAAARKLVAIFNAEGLKALDLADGKVVWEYPWKTSYDVNAANSIILGDKIFLTSGYGVGCAMLKADTGEQVWKGKAMASQYTTPILYNGFFYGIHGSTNQQGTGKGDVVCMDLDGNKKWSQPGYGVGSLMMADGKLIIQGEQGQLVVAEANPESFKKLGETKSIEKGICWTMPVLSGGVIYCRCMEGDLVAMDVSGK